jgi:hypothetical protein
MDKCLPKNDDVRKLTRWIGSLDPHQIPFNNVTPKLRFAFPLPFTAGPCCGMRQSVPLMLIRPLFTLPLFFLFSKTI